MPEVKPEDAQVFTAIKVVGVGGAGGAAINRMKEAGLKGVQFIAINTDAKALHNSKADVKVHIGHSTTKGLGAGADPTKGEAAAVESYEEIKNAILGADMVFIAFGAGGGTGSGAAYLVARAAKEEGILTVCVVTKPFEFELAKRKANSDWALEKIRDEVDALIIVPNDRLLQIISPTTPILETFKLADDVLRQGVQGIAELITENALIETDFADVEAIMRGAGTALMGIGRQSGENRAILAMQQAIESPLIEVSIDGARGLLINFTGGFDLTMQECADAIDQVKKLVAPDANMIWGVKQKAELEDEIIVTVVATGFNDNYSGNKSSFMGGNNHETVEIPSALNNMDIVSDNKQKDHNDFLNDSNMHKNDLVNPQPTIPQPQPSIFPTQEMEKKAEEVNPLAAATMTAVASVANQKKDADPFAKEIKKAEKDLEKPAFSRGLFGFKRHDKDKAVDRDKDY